MRRFQRGIRAAGLAGLCALAAPAAVSGGDAAAQQLLDRMLQRYRANVAEIDDYSLEMDGHTLHYRKRVIDGWPSFQVRAEVAEGGRQDIIQAAAAPAASIFDRRVFEELRAKAVYGGSQRLDGRTVHALRADRLEGLFQEDGPAVAEDFRLFVNAQTLNIDRMQMRILLPGQPGPAEVTIRMEDYRNVRGLAVPYRTSVSVAGLDAGLSEEDRQQAREALRQLEQLPREQRALAERMMRDRLPQMRQVLSGEPMTLVSLVRRVRVNTGLPGVSFAP